MCNDNDNTCCCATFVEKKNQSDKQKLIIITLMVLANRPSCSILNTRKLFIVYFLSFLEFSCPVEGHFQGDFPVGGSLAPRPHILT